MSIISTHAPLAGRDAREASTGQHAHISTHAPLAGRDPEAPEATSESTISTHAPLAGRDFRNDSKLYEDRHFNPRAPCGARL